MVEPVSATIAAAEGLASVAQQLGVLDKLKRKLVKQPDVASAKLETALIEVSKVYGALGGAVDEYLGLWLLPAPENKKLRTEIAKLRRLAAGSHEADMRKAKGDCKKIWSIYKAYLEPWFVRVLNTDEQQQLFGLFRELMEFDSTMVDAIDATAEWLTAEASKTLSLVQAKDYDGADRKIQEAWAHWQPAAALLRDSMKRLYELRAYFIEVTGAV